MSIVSTQNTEFKVGSTSSTLSKITELLGATLTQTQNFHSARALDDTLQTHWKTTTDFNIQIDFLDSAADTATAALVEGNFIAFEYSPNGTGVGQPTFTGEALVVSSSQSTAMDNAVSVSVTLQGKGVLNVAVTAASNN